MAAIHRVYLLEPAALLRGNIIEGSILAALQRAHVCNYRPPVRHNVVANASFLFVFYHQAALHGVIRRAKSLEIIMNSTFSEVSNKSCE